MRPREADGVARTFDSRPLFILDAETDGLYGHVWAIAAIVTDETGSELATFTGQIDPSTVTDPWVLENVVPHVDLQRYDSARALRDAFWSFWIEHRQNTVALADCGAPVEAGLFRACVEDDLEARQWLGPYPLHDIATALLLAGLDPLASRFLLGRLPAEMRPHNPLDDARASAACWRMARAILSGPAPSECL